MTASPPPIREEDLHAYVDGWLPAAQLDAVHRYLAANPEDARRTAAWAAQRDAIRELVSQQPTDPLPPKLNLSRLVEERLRRRRVPWLAAASVLLALGLGTAGGWLLRTPPASTRTELAMSVLEQLGFASHAVYAADKRHPIEVAATDRQHLVQWLSNRLDRQVAPPDLAAAGFQLIGGRLLATERGGAAALFMYQDAHGLRLSLVLRPMSWDLRAGFAEVREGPVNNCAWIADGLGYAVVGPLSGSELRRLADTIQRSG